MMSDAKRYAVTGATGLVGQALVKLLADQDHFVRALYRSDLPKAFTEHANIEPFKASLSDAQSLEMAFQNIDGVFHVAAFAKPWVKDPSTYYTINVDGTKLVCSIALKQGVQRVVVTSSAGIHGPQLQDAFIHENLWPDRYFTDYEQSKFEAHQIALSFVSQGLEVNLVSPSRVYGPAPITESNVPGRMMKMYLKNGFALAPLNGTGIGSYSLVDDVVKGHLIAMETHEVGEEYLLGGVNVNYLDFFQILKEVSGVKRPLIKVPYQLSLGIGKTQHLLAEQFNIQPSITTPWIRKYLKDWGVSSEKIQRLGYQITPLEVGMKKVIESLS